jgi:hypothetical protein
MTNVPPTAAERMRSYRKRHKEGVRVTGKSVRDHVPERRDRLGSSFVPL